MELITVEDFMEELQGFDELAEKFEYVLATYKPPLNGERYLTSIQVCKLLNITKRTLLEYREKGMLYKESDLLAILEENYIPRF